MSKQTLNYTRIRPRRMMQQLAFGALYRFGGSIYDRLAHLLFGAAWDEWRTTVLGLIESEPVLDLGAGTGKLLAQMSQRGGKGIGIERSPSMLHRARRLLGPGALIQADAEQLPIRTGSIGACVSTYPCWFILDPGVLAEIVRVLRPDGQFIIMFSGRFATPERQPRFRRLLLYLFYGSVTGEPDLTRLTPVHTALRGEWTVARCDSGTAILWLGRRISCGDLDP